LSPTVRGEHRLKVFGNRVLRGMFEPKRYEVIGNLRKLHYDENDNFCSSPSIIKMIRSKMRWVGHVERLSLKHVKNMHSLW
jgi:hypothetical protein